MKEFQIGDSVLVEAGVFEPNNNVFNISGWQGRIISIDKYGDNVFIGISWNSITLSNMPKIFIKHSE